MAYMLASFCDILQDGGCQNLTSWRHFPGSYRDLIDRYHDGQNTFPTLTASLARNTHLKKLEVDIDQSVQELFMDCILPALAKNQGITDLTMNVGEEWDVHTADLALAVWTGICEVVFSNDCLLSLVFAGKDDFYDFYDEESIPQEKRVVFFHRFKSCLLQNYVLEKIEFRDNLSAISADIAEINSVPERNQLLRSTREFIQQLQGHPNDDHQDSVIREKFVQLHSAVKENPLILPALHELVKAFVPNGSPDLLFRLKLLFDK